MGKRVLAAGAGSLVRDGTNLDEHYYREQINVVDRQMALAGLRLAKLLYETIGKMTPRDFRCSGIAYSIWDFAAHHTPAKTYSCCHSFT